MRLSTTVSEPGPPPGLGRCVDAAAADAVVLAGDSSGEGDETRRSAGGGRREGAGAGGREGGREGSRGRRDATRRAASRRAIPRVVRSESPPRPSRRTRAAGERRTRGCCGVPLHVVFIARAAVEVAADRADARGRAVVGRARRHASRFVQEGGRGALIYLTPGAGRNRARASARFAVRRRRRGRSARDGGRGTTGARRSRRGVRCGRRGLVRGRVVLSFDRVSFTLSDHLMMSQLLPFCFSDAAAGHSTRRAAADVRRPTPSRSSVESRARPRSPTRARRRVRPRARPGRARNPPRGEASRHLADLVGVGTFARRRVDSARRASSSPRRSGTERKKSGGRGRQKIPPLRCRGASRVRPRCTR